MIIKEFFKTREDGVNLFITYSSLDVKIQCVNTGIIYDNVVDREDSIDTYIETDILIEEREEV